MAEHRSKRRRILIDPLQVKLLAITMLYFGFIVAVFGAAMFAPLIWQLNTGEPGPEQLNAASEFLALHRRFWPALLVTFALLSAHSVLTSHRIAGPLYRFRVVFGEIQRGNLSLWVGLRRHDLLLKEAEALNDMIVGLREGLLRLSRQGHEARRHAAALERSLHDGDTTHANDHLAGLRRALDDLERQVAGYSLDAEGSDDVGA